MAIYLVEDEIGFDDTLVGFPSLGGCMALVMQTETGLFGFHIPPGHKDRAGAFGQFCKAKRDAGAQRHLYGSCYWNNRYAGLDNKFLRWMEEMRYVAAQIDYAGPMSGFDTSASQSNIGVNDATRVATRSCRT